MRIVTCHLSHHTPSKKWKWPRVACDESARKLHVGQWSGQVSTWRCGERNDMSTKGFEIRSTVPVCCVCVIVCCLRLCLCLCLCHVLSFTYVFTDHLLVSFTYHLPVGLSVSEAARVRAHFEFFFEWFSKGSLQKYMNEPCFSFGCVVRLPLFFLVVQYLRGWGYLQARPCSRGLHPPGKANKAWAPEAKLLSLAVSY